MQLIRAHNKTTIFLDNKTHHLVANFRTQRERENKGESIQPQTEESEKRNKPKRQGQAKRVREEPEKVNSQRRTREECQRMTVSAVVVDSP